MTAYTSCLMQGYGVLPGPPLKVHITNIDTEYAIVHWTAPATLGDTVLSYNLYYRALALSEDYSIIEKV